MIWIHDRWPYKEAKPCRVSVSILSALAIWPVNLNPTFIGSEPQRPVWPIRQWLHSRIISLAVIVKSAAISPPAKLGRKGQSRDFPFRTSRRMEQMNLFPAGPKFPMARLRCHTLFFSLGRSKMSGAGETAIEGKGVLEHRPADSGSNDVEMLLTDTFFASLSLSWCSPSQLSFVCPRSSKLSGLIRFASLQPGYGRARGWQSTAHQARYGFGFWV
jgi:hypothetical protein